MRLAQALKFAGYRARLLIGRGSVSVRWQVGLGGMIRGLEKNFFAAMGFRLEKALGGGRPAHRSSGVMPYVGLFVGPWWARLACGLGVASIAATVGAIVEAEPDRLVLRGPDPAGGGLHDGRRGAVGRPDPPPGRRPVAGPPVPARRAEGPRPDAGRLDRARSGG